MPSDAVARRPEGRMVSALPGIAWPAWPSPQDAVVLSLLHQLDSSQWQSPEQLAPVLAEQLGQVIAHAMATVPFYRERFRGRFDGAAPDAWLQLPLLQRGDVQEHGRALTSEQPPPSHGGMTETATSGSTGTPIKARGTQVVSLFFQAMKLRTFLWHELDFAAKVGAIRRLSPGQGMPPDGVREAGWAPLYRTGPAVGLNIAASVPEQLAWLVQEQPDYLLSYPTNLQALAEYCLQHGVAVPSIKRVLTMGETVSAATREACAEAWRAPVIDQYSAMEIGIIAVQCPQADHYHVMSEDLLVEVLAEDGRQCAPGEVGRVVITTLHNFAMPLIRYAIGDLAEVGAPCPCGRGLPVLRRILGRSRNMLVLPSGERRWPSFQPSAIIAPVRQFQVTQKSLGHLAVKLVVARPLQADEEADLRTALLADIGCSFDISLHYVDAIPRSSGGKFEQFICELDADK